MFFVGVWGFSSLCKVKLWLSFLQSVHNRTSMMIGVSVGYAAIYVYIVICKFGCYLMCMSFYVSIYFNLLVRLSDVCVISWSF